MILITNDDGIYADGLLALARELKNIDDIVIVAPSEEQSAVGHAITLSEPLRIHRVRLDDNLFGWATNGRPADAVKLGVKVILKKSPQLIVSGINLGENVGSSLMYSGTVSAATEGTLLGIPSVAVSLVYTKNPDYSFAAKFTSKVAHMVIAKGLPHGVLLNINVPSLPPENIKGVRITKQGKSFFADFFEERTDLQGKNYLWMGGRMVNLDEDKDSDYNALSEGYISITPIQLDLTDYKFIEQLKKWDLNI